MFIKTSDKPSFNPTFFTKRQFSFSKKDDECMHLQELQYFSVEGFENLLACKSVGL